MPKRFQIIRWSLSLGYFWISNVILILDDRSLELSSVLLYVAFQSLFLFVFIKKFLSKELKKTFVSRTFNLFLGWSLLSLWVLFSKWGILVLSQGNTLSIRNLEVLFSRWYLLFFLLMEAVGLVVSVLFSLIGGFRNIEDENF